MVRGIILALREEEGLKKLNEGRPAAMINICGRHAAEYSMDLLAQGGIRQGMILLNSPDRTAEACFQGAVRNGLQLRVLCTGSRFPAAALATAWGSSNTVVILDGAVLCGFDVKEAIRQHRKSGKSASAIFTSKGDTPAGWILSRGVQTVLSAAETESSLEECLQRMGVEMGRLHMDGFCLPFRNEESYLLGQRAILCGKGEPWGLCPGHRDEEGNILRSRLPLDCRVTPPVFVGRGVSIGRDVVLESGTVLENFSAVGAGARLQGTIAPIGSAAVDGACLSSHILCPEGEEGHTPHIREILHTGQALGVLCRGKGVAIGHDGSAWARAAALVLCGGLMTSGARVLDCGSCPWGAYLYAWRDRRAEAGVYLTSKGKEKIRLLAPGGLPLTGRMYQDLLDLESIQALPPVPDSAAGSRRVMEDPQEDYARLACAMAAESLWGTRCKVICLHRETRLLAGNLLARLGCRPGEDTLVLDPLGEKAELICQDGRRYTWEEILAELSIDRMACGADVALPLGVIPVLEQTARQLGRQVLRYSPDPCGGQDAAARSLAVDQLWVRDGLLAGIAFLSLLRHDSFLLTAAPISKYNKTIINNLCKLH